MHISCLTHEIELPDLGVRLTLRPAQVRDEYAAVALVPVPKGQDIDKDGVRKLNASQEVAYQMAVSDMVMLCQIVSVDGVSPPDSLVGFLDELTPDDMAALREGAGDLKKKRLLLKSASRPGAPSSAPSSSADSASTTSAAPS